MRGQILSSSFQSYQNNADIWQLFSLKIFRVYFYVIDIHWQGEKKLVISRDINGFAQWCHTPALKITDPVLWPSPALVRIGTSWPPRCSRARRQAAVLPHGCSEWVGWMAEGLSSRFDFLRGLSSSNSETFICNIFLCVYGWCLEKCYRHICSSCRGFVFL